MYSFSSRIRYSELAEDRKISLLSIINYFQDVSNFESEEKGVGLRWLSEHGNVWMLTSWQIVIERRPKLGEKVVSKTWACGFRHFIGKRNFVLEDENGECLAYALSDWAYLNIETAKPAKIPEEEYEAYGIADPLDKPFEKGKIKIPAELETREAYVIRMANIDTNHHVNNGQYIAICEEYLPKDFNIMGVRAEYKGQSHLGDVLIPKIGKTEKGIVVILCDKEENIRLITEFIGG